MSARRRYTRDEQRAILTRHAQPGYWRLATMLRRRQFEIQSLGIERAMSIGHEEYDDRLFRKELTPITVDTMQELADGCVYQSVWDWIAAGRPDP